MSRGLRVTTDGSVGDVVSVSYADEVLYEKERLSQKIQHSRVDDKRAFSAGKDRLYHSTKLGVSVLSLPSSVSD